MATPSAELDWRGALDAIAAAQSILVVSHVAPDGDAVGSLLGMALALRARGKQVTAAIDEGVPAELAFVPGSEFVLPALASGDFDLMLSVDASDIERIGEAGKYGLAHSQRVINLDHHPTNTRFGDIHLIAPQAVAAAEIVYDFLTFADWTISCDMASALLVGLVTDTQGFRIPATNSRTLAIAQALMEAGAPLPDIMARTLNRRSYAEIKLWQRVLPSVQLNAGLISAAITQDDIGSAGLYAMSDGGLVSHLVNVDEAKIAVVFKELSESVEVSFRAKPGCDVAKLAFGLGGGGHVLASGCTLAGTLEAAQATVLPLARQAIAEGGGA